MTSCNWYGAYKEMKSMYNTIVAHASAIVKDVTYRPKHTHRINWDGTMHERGRLACAVITGLMLGFFLFATMTM